MFYLDASVAVAAITQEDRSERIWQWFERHADVPILCSGWTSTEVASALSIKVRTGAFTLENRLSAWNSWCRFREASLAEIDIAADAFETAASFCARPDLGLRAGDALHLAVVRTGNLTLLTLDRTMADAALQIGIPVEPL